MGTEERDPDDEHTSCFASDAAPPSGASNTAPPSAIDELSSTGAIEALADDSSASEPDPGEFEPSDYDASSIQSDSTSINSSVLYHTYQNGRRYHQFRHGRYPIPNDESEQNREDMLHAMMLEMTDGRHFFAPIEENPQKILDIGTGTGTWAMEVGDMYPSAEIIGVDLSPIQPVWVPPNVKFIVDDIEDTWMNGDNFDFIHWRNVAMVLKDEVKLLKEIYKNLKPGAWVELQDVDGEVNCDDGTLPDDWPMTKFCDLMTEAFEKLGISWIAAKSNGEKLQEAGFVNIQHRALKMPYGTWPKNKTMRLIGHYYRLGVQDFFPAMGTIQMPLLGWKPEESEVFFAQCRAALKDESVHAYGLMHFWSAQKPE